MWGCTAEPGRGSSIIRSTFGDQSDGQLLQLVRSRLLAVVFLDEGDHALGDAPAKGVNVGGPDMGSAVDQGKVDGNEEDELRRVGQGEQRLAFLG